MTRAAITMGSGSFLHKQIDLMEAWLENVPVDEAKRHEVLRYFVIYLRRYVVPKPQRTAFGVLHGPLEELEAIAHDTKPDLARFRALAAEVFDVLKTLDGKQRPAMRLVPAERADAYVGAHP